jgi:hypothetical protein
MQHDGIASLEEVFSLAFVAEGMIVVKFTGSTIISAAACLVAAYYVFNAEYPPREQLASAKTIVCSSSIFCLEGFCLAGLVKFCQSVLRISSTIVKNIKCIVDYRTQDNMAINCCNIL